ncbi:MAG: hypothetical protein ABI266_02570 [Ginsengibacter sp.]
MKKAIILYGCIFLLGNTGFSQLVNGVNLKDIGVEYLEISERPILLKGAKINLLVNYGQPIKEISDMQKFLMDSAGKKIEFNSIIDGLNFMSDHGYEVVQTYKTDSVSYLMRKKKNE